MTTYRNFWTSLYSQFYNFNLQEPNEILGSEMPLEYQESYTSNGIRIVTESPDIPNSTTIVFCFSSGC